MLSVTTVPCGSTALHETLNSLGHDVVRSGFISFVSGGSIDIEADEITVTEEADDHTIAQVYDKSGYDLEENQHFRQSRSPIEPPWEVRSRCLGMTYVEAEFTLTTPNLDAAKFIDGMLYHDGQLDITINGHTLSYDKAMLSEVSWWDDDMVLSIRLKWACVGEAR